MRSYFSLVETLGPYNGGPNRTIKVGVFSESYVGECRGKKLLRFVFHVDIHQSETRREKGCSEFVSTAC